jgi:hypothetical protein
MSFLESRTFPLEPQPTVASPRETQTLEWLATFRGNRYQSGNMTLVRTNTILNAEINYAPLDPCRVIPSTYVSLAVGTHRAFARRRGSTPVLISRGRRFTSGRDK